MNKFSNNWACVELDSRSINDEHDENAIRKDFTAYVSVARPSPLLIGRGYTFVR